MQKFKSFFMLVLITSLFTFGIESLLLFAGSLEPPGSPAPTMNTLDDIYKRITTGSNAAAHSLDPSGPPASTMHTLQEIYNAIPGVLTNPATAAAVLNGKSVIIRSNGQMLVITGIGTIGTNFFILRTGQIMSYIAGDDGTYRKGFTKGYTNADGSWNGATRFTDNGDNTVTDNITGLMWTKNANQGPGATRWTNAMNGADTCLVGGYSDWRLPNVRELLSIIDYKNQLPALPTGHPFINVQNNWYWTSTTYKPDTAYAGVVSLLNGIVNFDDKGINFYVWYCRAGQ